MGLGTFKAFFKWIWMVIVWIGLGKFVFGIDIVIIHQMTKPRLWTWNLTRKNGKHGSVRQTSTADLTRLRMTDSQHQASNRLAIQFHSKTHRSIVQLFPSERTRLVYCPSIDPSVSYLCLACSLLPRGIDGGLFALLASYMFDKTLELKAKSRWCPSHFRSSSLLQYRLQIVFLVEVKEYSERLWLYHCRKRHLVYLIADPDNWDLNSMKRTTMPG